MTEFTQPDAHVIEDPLVFVILALILLIFYMWGTYRTRL